jgi:signal transduction histidine kinase
VAEEIFDLMEFQMRAKGLKKEIYVDPSLERVTIFSDKGRIFQILLNLLQNAFKFTYAGYLKILIEDITIPKFETDPNSNIKRIMFRTIDTGVGIKQEDQQKLFKVFGKLSASAAINPEGIGLGLIICSKIVKEMGGVIKVISEEGKGSTFAFTLDLEVQPMNLTDNTS